ncbi:MAG: hypothetical protein U0132_13355 [Gemmatimonadaceae bacterium]
MAHVLSRLILFAGVGSSAAAATARIEVLERRVETLESRLDAAPQSSTVKAPFTVVDAANHPILTVDATPRALSLFDEHGRVGVFAYASPAGGHVSASEPGGAIVAIDAQQNAAKLTINEGSQPRVQLGYSPSDGTALTLRDASHAEVVHLGSVTGGGSRLDLTTSDRRRTASLSALPGRAAVALREGAGAERAALSLEADGSPEMVLSGAGHEPLASITGSQKGASAALYSGAKPSVLIESHSGGGIILTRNAGGNRVAVMSAENDEAEVSLRDAAASENRRAAMLLGTGDAKDKPAAGDASEKGGLKLEVALWSEAHHKTVMLGADADSGGGQLSLGDAKGQILATVGAAPVGGFFRAQNPSATRVALMGTGTDLAMLTLRDGPRTPRATLALPNDGVPALVILNKAHDAAAVFSHGAEGGGIFQLRDPKGRPIVEGGTMTNGHGMVRAGPFFQCAGTFAGLMAPDCIMGRGGKP